LKRKSDHPHLVMANVRTKRVTGHMTVRCSACDDEFTVVLPCSMLMPGAIFRQWEKEHGPCAAIRDRFRAELLGVMMERATGGLFAAFVWPNEAAK